jgi:hypothetical protein
MGGCLYIRVNMGEGSYTGRVGPRGPARHAYGATTPLGNGATYARAAGAAFSRGTHATVACCTGQDSHHTYYIATAPLPIAHESITRGAIWKDKVTWRQLTEMTSQTQRRSSRRTRCPESTREYAQRMRKSSGKRGKSYYVNTTCKHRGAHGSKRRTGA